MAGFLFGIDATGYHPYKLLSLVACFWYNIRQAAFSVDEGITIILMKEMRLTCLLEEI
jgi:hypothetical protein